MAVNTSVYWAASTIGQISIAAALGATCVFIDCKDFEDMREFITKSRTSMLGIAPTVADQLYTSGTCGLILPTVEVLFTWGEPLKDKTLRKVRAAEAHNAKHRGVAPVRGVAIRELLVKKLLAIILAELSHPLL